jgi:uncharacterized membrane protein YcaP (DUF421 family)
MLFDSWEGLWRVLAVGVMAYIGLLFLLRISGKRTLSKLNAFDLIVTVALGSTLATVLLSRDVALLEGILAFAVLIGAQYLITTLSVRSALVRRLVKSEPRLLFYRGRMLSDALREERVTRNEVRAVVRARGFSDLGAVEAVVLETDGSFNVIGSGGSGQGTALTDVIGFRMPHRSAPADPAD